MFVSLNETRLADDPDNRLDRGLISRTVGGSETLVKLILGSAPQPDSTKAASSQSNDWRQPV